MRTLIGIGIVITSVIALGWWGLLSLIVALPFIGWKDRHKGPFPTNQAKTSDYTEGNKLSSEMPLSFKRIQDLLIEIEDEGLTSDDLHVQLHVLRGHLRYEKYGDNYSDKEILTDTFNRFSNAFPNWQKEYSIINDAIEKEF